MPDDMCPHCGHEWRRHDPEDGRCDAHSAEQDVFGPCRCGRDVTFTAAANARLSRAALNAARASDPASVLAALLAESPEATVAAIEALLTSDLRAVTMHPAWNRVDGRKWAGTPRSDMAEVVIEAACRSLLSKAPKEDGVSDEGGN